MQEVALKPPKKSKRGHIYFIKCGDFVKIGFATNVAQRMAGIKTSTPYEFELIATCPGGRDLEKKLHTRFAYYHHRGEWFHYSSELYRAVYNLRINVDHRSTIDRLLDEDQDPYNAGSNRAFAKQES